MSNPYVGEIRLLPYNFAPSGWAFCDGQLLAISENEVLFSLIGTTYGGDGTNTFALPDLRSRTPLHRGPRPGGANHVIGESGGAGQVTLSAVQLPAHTHAWKASSIAGNSLSPADRYAATDGTGRIYPFATTTNTQMSAPSSTGGGQPHENTPPFLALHFCISLFGIYPSSS